MPPTHQAPSPDGAGATHRTVSSAGNLASKPTRPSVADQTASRSGPSYRRICSAPTVATGAVPPADSRSQAVRPAGERQLAPSEATSTSPPPGKPTRSSLPRASSGMAPGVKVAPPSAVMAIRRHPAAHSDITYPVVWSTNSTSASVPSSWSGFDVRPLIVMPSSR